MIVKNLDIDIINFKRILKKYKTVKIKNYVISNCLVDKFRVFNEDNKKVIFYNDLDLILNTIKSEVSQQISFKI